MSVQDTTAHPPLPGRPRRFRWGYYGMRALLVVLLLAVAALLPASHGARDQFRYREGDIVRDRVVAPYDFRIEKDELSLRREQAQAATAVPPVFGVDPRVSSESLNRFALFQANLLRVVMSPSGRPVDRAVQLRGLGVPLGDETALSLTSPGRARRVLTVLGRWLHDVYDAGVVAEKHNNLILGYRSISLRDGETEQPRAVTLCYDRREALATIEERAGRLFADDAASLRAVSEIAPVFVQPNIVFDRYETEWRRVQAQGAVTSTVGTVKKDELIVDANQKLTHDALLKLRTLSMLEVARKGRTESLLPPAARLLLMLLFVAGFLTYLRMELPAVYQDNAMLGMFTLLAIVVMAAAELMVGVFGLSEFVVPLAVAPLVVASLLEKRPALVYTLLLTTAVAAVEGLKAPFVAAGVMAGVTAVYSVARLRHRWHFVRALFTIALANLVAILAWDLAHAAATPAVMRDALWGLANSFLAVSLAYMLLPLVENLFGLTSDITLLELSDLNRPLLRRLQLEASGTYHHSMVVGTLAETAAEAIGANSLLARVSAYYHDIGKLAKPEYYNENELIARSRHDKLTPSMSALVLRSHVTEGVEMARRQRLPKAVRDAIPEHHGTMAMAFFYVRALEADPGARREDFSYPGPRPRSKETAILMLADGVEGASRALEEPTPSRIRGLVKRIIDERLQDGQLDESGLTLQELARIREAFIPVLVAIHHVRAVYPEEPKKRDPKDLRRRSRDADFRRG